MGIPQSYPGQQYTAIINQPIVGANDDVLCGYDGGWGADWRSVGGIIEWARYGMPNYVAPNKPGVCGILRQEMDNPNLSGKENARLLLCATNEADPNEYAEKYQVGNALLEWHQKCLKQDGQRYGGTKKLAETKIWQLGPTDLHTDKSEFYIVIDRVLCSKAPCM
ncbi:MAG: hypothetical protein M1831_007567 [Alyxoria varia]|nr:MAG: hypothetical protein M1831_007567 [Alyxoria varia]